MQLLEETGIVAAVGKVNMDVNCPGYYGESTIKSIGETVRWIEASKRRFRSVFPILTPRFAPVCSPELMTGLGDLQQKYALPLQSHLSENRRKPNGCNRFFRKAGFTVRYMTGTVFSAVTARRLWRIVFIRHRMKWLC